LNAHRLPYSPMDLIDLGPSIIRSVIALWPCAVTVVVVAILALGFRMRKQVVIAFAVFAFALGVFKQSPTILTQWRLGMLEAESPIANEAAFKQLSQNLKSVHVERLLRDQREDPNVRFAMALILLERDQLR